MASFAFQRCLSVSPSAPRRTQGTYLPTRTPVISAASRPRHVATAGLGDMLDIGRNERKALLHTFYHDLDMQKLVCSMAAHCLRIFGAQASVHVFAGHALGTRW
jgi:hypothetical protein